MKTRSTFAASFTALALAPSAAAGGVVIAMPAPPAATAPATESYDAPAVGAVALVRYGHRRVLPRSNGSDPGWGAWSGGPWDGGWGFPISAGYRFGGYRISLGHHLFARRAWNGGYVRPAWGWRGW